MYKTINPIAGRPGYYGAFQTSDPVAAKEQLDAEWNRISVKARPETVTCGQCRGRGTTHAERVGCERCLGTGLLEEDGTPLHRPAHVE